MNPATLEDARRIARKTRTAAAQLVQTDVVICPPSIFAAALISKKNTPNFNLGAQTASFEESGSHTGQISAAMLKNIGMTHVIVGHSEERAAGDTDEMISRRIRAVLEAGLTPVVCVGEKSRDNEGGAHFEFLKDQIRNTFANISEKYAREIVLAYEPVWAIGAKEAMSPEQIYEMSLFVKKVFGDVFGQASAMKVPVVYGGSVTFRNAADIIAIGQVDGLLVGRESVNVTGFVELLKVVDTAKADGVN